MNEAVKETKIVVNENNLPDYLKTDPVTKAPNEGAVRLEEYFGNDGYVVANINRLTELSPQIKQFSEILDKRGRRFFEIHFKKLKSSPKSGEEK